MRTPNTHRERAVASVPHTCLGSAQVPQGKTQYKSDPSWTQYRVDGHSVQLVTVSGIPPSHRPWRPAPWCSRDTS